MTYMTSLRASFADASAAKAPSTRRCLDCPQPIPVRGGRVRCLDCGLTHAARLRGIAKKARRASRTAEAAQ